MKLYWLVHRPERLHGPERFSLLKFFLVAVRCCKRAWDVPEMPGMSSGRLISASVFKVQNRILGCVLLTLKEFLNSLYM